MVLTHLHADHVGWNTREVNGEWAPTFPHARYLTSRVEREFWAGYAMDEARGQMFRDSVIPVQEAGLLDLLDVPAEGAEVAPGLRLVPTPGHTPGHLAVELASAGADGTDHRRLRAPPRPARPPRHRRLRRHRPGQSEASRRRLLGSLAGTDTLLLGTHFAPPTAGRVVTHEGAYRLSPLCAGSP